VFAVQKRLERGDPVGFWLGRLTTVTRVNYRCYFRHFLVWLNRRPGWSGVDAAGLLLRQAEAEDPFELLELLQEYVNGLDKTLSGKLGEYSTVRSFFDHNRCPLPRDPNFQIRSDKPGVTPKLVLEHIVDLSKASTVRDRSIILVKWQSLQDNTRLVWISNHCAEQLVSQIKTEAHPVRIDLPMGRKKNKKPYYTFIGRDAVDALVAYFEKERLGGWPRAGEPIWYMKHWGGQRLPLTVPGLAMIWLQLLRRVGLIPKQEGPKGIKYGFNLHEMRDIAKSHLHTHAVKDGFDMDLCKWIMGHGKKIDPSGYDKFHENIEYAKKQYLIAEKHLNILSNMPSTQEMEKYEERLMTVNVKLARVEEILKKIGELPNEETKKNDGPMAAADTRG